MAWFLYFQEKPLQRVWIIYVYSEAIAPARMFKKVLFIALIVCGGISAFSQEFVYDLYGFRLGQYREAASNELGAPHQSGKFEDNSEFEYFLLMPDTSLYMIIEYAADHPNVIWSLRITGTSKKTALDFFGLKFGMSEKQVEKKIGKPDNIMKDDNFGIRWDYPYANYTIGMVGGKLNTIKIKSLISTRTPKLYEHPDLVKMYDKLSSDDNKLVAEAVLPSIKITYVGKEYYFKRSLKTEIITDDSKVFNKLREFAKGLDRINVDDPSQYAEDVQYDKASDPLPMIKVWAGHHYKEIVFRYVNGEFKISRITVETTY